MTDEEREVFEEKSAMYEYLGGFSREEAERMAREDMEREAAK